MSVMTSSVPALRPRPVIDPVRVRRRRSGDLAGASRLLGVVYCADHYPDRLPGSKLSWLVDDVLDAWVVERDNLVIGHVGTVAVGTDPLSAARWRELTGLSEQRLRGVSRLFVRRSWRQRGVGSALLRVASEDIRRRGLVPALETVTESRTVLPALRRTGWQLLAVDPRDATSGRWWVHRYLSPGSWS